MIANNTFRVNKYPSRAHMKELQLTSSEPLQNYYQVTVILFCFCVHNNKSFFCTGNFCTSPLPFSEETKTMHVLQMVQEAFNLLWVCLTFVRFKGNITRI